MRGLCTLRNAVFCIIFSGMLGQSSSAEQGNPKAGKVTYDTMCAACHGVTGEGNGPVAHVMPRRPRNHTDGAYMNQLEDDYLFKIIKEGGVAVGRAPFMPAWGAQIKDSEIWDVVAYLRTLAVPPYQPSATADPTD